MLTRLEAEDRAARICGPKKIERLRLFNYRPCWGVTTKDQRTHVMDENGHVDCHPSCIKAEENLSWDR